MVNAGEMENWAADLENWSLISFPQTWSSTALGFGGIGGQAITSAQTVVFTDHHYAFVYFGGGFAYFLERPNDLFWKDLTSQRLEEVSKASIYRRKVEV